MWNGTKRIVIFAMSFFCLLLTACHEKTSYQGYIDGEYRYMSSYYAGTLKQLLVTRGAWVKAGQPLYVLEAQPESDQEKGALAQAQELHAQLSLAQVTYQRDLQLVKQGYLDRQTFDQAASNLKALEAQLSSIDASIAQAKWAVGQKTIKSPTDAFVFDTYYLPGELVAAGRPVLSLLAPENIKIIFFIPEKVLASVHLGQKVFLKNSPKINTTATINYISPQAEYTPPVIYSQQTQDKLVYRIEAKPDDLKNNMHPGQPVAIEFHHDK